MSVRTCTHRQTTLVGTGTFLIDKIDRNTVGLFTMSVSECACVRASGLGWRVVGWVSALGWLGWVRWGGLFIVIYGWRDGLVLFCIVIGTDLLLWFYGRFCDVFIFDYMGFREGILG